MNIKVLDCAQEEETLKVRGKDLHKKNFTIADSTESMILSAWENNIEKLEVGHSYMLKQVTVRIYADVKFLNSNLETVIEEISDIGSTHQGGVQVPGCKVLIGEIIGAQVMMYNSCSLCHKTMNFEDSVPLSARCPHCHTRQKTANCKKTVFARLHIKEGNDQAKTYTIFESILESFMANSKGATVVDIHSASKDDIEDFLIECGEVTATVNAVDSVITKITHADI